VGYDLRTNHRVALRLYTRPDNVSDTAWNAAVVRYSELLTKHQKVQTHPAIQKVLRFGLENDTLFIVSEYFEGCTLREQMDEGQPIDPDHLVWVLRMTADALDHAASRGLVHADLNPFNILTTQVHRDVRVINFGLGYVRNRTGSPYQAPEQLDGRSAHTRFDIFALGCILVEGLLGRPPFLGAAQDETMARLRSGEQAELSRLPQTLQPVVGAMLAKDPSLRPESAVSAMDTVVRAHFGRL
jgi:serine/threonine protein kinase